MTGKLRMGLIGGGPGSFIGRVHRIAAELDGEAELVCGAFSSSAEKPREAGASYHIDPSRACRMAPTRSPPKPSNAVQVVNLPF